MARKVEVLEACDLGNDVLVVRGTIEGVTREVAKPVTDSKGKPRTTGRGRKKQQLVELVDEPIVLEARGWVSAFENHYPDEAYDDGGALKLETTKKGAPGDPLAEPRPMTSEERRAYCEQLLRDVAEQLPRPVEL
jgi:hypothetical protein